MRFICSFTLAILALSPGCNKNAGPVITVFAAASLKEVVTEISTDYSKSTSRQTKAQFDSSSTLARQIQEGALADIFITAAPEWLDKLNVIERSDWLSNRLVCVTLKEEKDFDIKKLESLALGGDQVPAGKYAKAALDSLKIPVPTRVIYGSSVRDVLSKVAEGGAKAGIVYATDAAIEPRVKIVYTFPENSHPKIVYSIGLIRPEGKDFYDSLRSPASITRAIDRGFIELK